MPDIKYLPSQRVKPESAWLNAHARKVMSQTGQEGIVEKIFDVMGANNKFCVEFGAWDGKHFCNTWELLTEKGWSGALIEGNAKRCKDIVRNHNNNPKLQVVNALVGWDGPDSLDNLLERAGAPKDFDFISIDIDGNDWHVWNGLVKHRPRLLLIEFNPAIPNDVHFVQDRDPKISQGSSARAMVELGKTKGYSLVCAHQFDAFFVPDELFPLFKIADNSLDAMYDQTPYETKLFYGFDGTIYTAGRDKLMWKKDAYFNRETFQVLPKEQRVWNT